ncbi:MAG: DUF2029 domain-containing protein, partial [Anaerolineae bacterium]|nr:DUF2029 domain-containing protein [Armatimonadota bacterium]NIN68674.1 DUF2029 domain-containing protein [Anaerolineae bacterium]NIN96221.1 DUF2029 domain-containing protein [Anaerolineae bacterium]
MDKRTLYAGLMVGLLLLAVLGLFVDLWIHFDTYQRDLRTYYYAGRAFAAGLDPYDLGVLSNLASTPLALPFLYPPAVLPLFRLLSSLEFSTAYYLFLGLKIAVLILLLGCWKKDFLPEMGFAFLVFSLLAFNAAIYVDLRVGNISLVEQGLIWLSFSFLLRKRVLLYCLMILLAASFKLMPLLFLALLLLNEDKRRFIYLAGSLLLFLSVQALSFLLAPNLFRAFLNGLGGLDERGVVNPSTMAMLRDLLDLYE